MKNLTDKLNFEMRKLADMPDEDINTDDMPEVKNWDNAVVGKFYRPVKQQLTIRLDADVVAWLKQDGKGYQTRANRILRDAMEHQRPEV